MKQWLYVIHSSSRDRYYIGHTNDLQRRLEEHNSRQTASTRSGRPWKLVYSKQFRSKRDAYAEERRLKRMKSRKDGEMITPTIRHSNAKTIQF